MKKHILLFALLIAQSLSMGEKGHHINKNMEVNYLYVANWKMNMHFDEANKFCLDNHDELQKLIKNSANTVVICPSFIAIPSVVHFFKDIPIGIGAQNCSSYKVGSYTGEISAQSLSEIGCTYCIIGHSERRTLFNETNDTIAQKCIQLLDNNIQPIICIGETKEEYENKKTITVLTKQLLPIFEVLNKYKGKKIVIAYEPVWSIGTGIIPESSCLQEIFAWLDNITSKEMSQHEIILLYGGSVNPTNIAQLKLITHIQGFLIGNASTNFTQFKAIIQSPN